jgi:hypothetical protein
MLLQHLSTASSMMNAAQEWCQLRTSIACAASSTRHHKMQLTALPCLAMNLRCCRRPALQIFLLLPPTPTNIARFVAWSSSSKQRSVFMASGCEGAVKVELTAGQTMLIPPGGWLVC